MATRFEYPDRPESKYLRRLEDLETERRPFEDEWQRITDYVLPRRSGWAHKTKEQDKSGSSKIFDGTATSALTLMCDGLLGHLVPASVPFFRLRSAIPRFEDVPIFRTWLDQAELHLLSALERSNFYSALGELFPDAGALGTAIMYLEEDIEEGRIFFSVRHLKECYLSENRWGVVDTVFRRFQMTRRKLLETFPSLSEAQQERAKKSPEQTVEVLHVVEPGERRAFDSTYILLDEVVREGTQKEAHILEEGGFDYFPYIVWRFRKNSEEVYGRSPAMDGIYDIEMLNLMAKTLAEAAHKTLDPPLIATESMRGRIRVNPRGITYVDSNAIGGQVATLYGGALGQYPIGTDAYERRARMVREHFRSDFFSYLLSEAGQGGGQRTATEVNAIEAQKAAVLGSTIGRVTKEVFEPVIRAMFAIEYDAERLPPVPEDLVQIVGLPLEIEYTGPLARKQKQYLRSQGVLDGAAAVFGLAQAKPEILDLFNWDYIGTEAAEANGIPQAALLDPKIVQKIRQARAQMQAAMQEAQMQIEGAKVMPALSKAPEPGSPAEQMQGGRR